MIKTWHRSQVNQNCSGTVLTCLEVAVLVMLGSLLHLFSLWPGRSDEEVELKLLMLQLGEGSEIGRLPD